MADPYVIFPGTAGNYVSTDDVNLLDADTAHLYQGDGAWGANAGVTENGIVPWAEAWSGSGLQFTATSDTGQSLTTWPQDAVPVAASTEHSLTISFKVSVPLAAPSVSARIAWFEGSSSLGSDDGTGYTASIGADEKVTVTVTATSPPTADSARLLLLFTGDTVGIGDTIVISDVCLREGTDTTFVPSLRIVGDLDLRMQLEPDDWDVSSFPLDLRRSVSGNGYALRVGSAAGTMRAYVGNQTDEQAFTLSGAHTIRLTWDVSETTGAVKWYQDGVLIDTNNAAGTVTYNYADVPLLIGAGGVSTQLLDGDIYWAEVRDGIDGPIVAEFQAGDVPVAAQLPA